MKRKVAMICVLLFFFIIGQAVNVTSEIVIYPTDGPTINSTTTGLDSKAAHITEPTSLPVVHKYKADVLKISKQVIVSLPKSFANTFRFPPPDVTELIGFIEVRKHQSNYLS